ncbi:MAG: OmpA family protein [Rhodospirillales bacterium]
MRRKILTIALATAAGWTAPAMAQVVVGGQGNSSVIVDYSVIGLPGGPSTGAGGYPYGSYAPGDTNLVMPNGQAPRSQFLADDIFGDTTVIGGSSAYSAPSTSAATPFGGGSALTPEAAALLGGQATEAPPPVAAPKTAVRKTPSAPPETEVAKAEPKIEVNRPTPPSPPKPEAPAAAPEPKQDVAAVAPAPKPEPAPAPAPVQTPPTPPKPPAPPAPAPAAAPAPPAPSPPAPTQEARAEPGPSLEVGDSSTLMFTPGEVRLPPEGTAAVEKIAEAAVADEEIRIQLLAYASADGGPSSTARRISLRRALNVRKVLIDKGVRAARIDVRALGNKVPDGNPDRVDVAITRR